MSKWMRQKVSACLRSATALLDVVLAGFDFTPGYHGDALVIERRNEFVPFCHLLQPGEIGLASLGEHVVLDSLEEFGDGVANVGLRDGILDASVSPDGEHLLFLQVDRANLKAKWDALDGTCFSAH